MARQTPTPSVSNLRSAAQAIRAALNTGDGLSIAKLADALTAAAGAFDDAQSAIETLEGKNRELSSPDTLNLRSRSSGYVSGDRIINGIQVQGGLATNAGQGLEFTFENQVGIIASKDHKDNSLLGLLIQGSTVTFTGTVSLGTALAVANGGTGLATLTAHALYVGNGTTAPVALGLGTTTTLLHGNAAGDPTWSAVSLTADVSGILPVANGGTGASTLTLAWQTPTFLNSWANNGSGFTAAEYTKTVTRQVLLAGCISPGTTNSGYIVVFNLPAGYRPATERYVTLPVSNGTTIQVGFAKIGTGGDVSLFNTSAFGSLFYLDCAFPID